MSALVLNRTTMLYNRNTGTYSPIVSKNKKVLSRIGKIKKCNLSKTLITTTPHCCVDTEIFVARSSLWDTNFIVQQSKVIGDGIVAYVFIYCSLNYFFYRRINNTIEKSLEEKDVKKSKEDDK